MCERRANPIVYFSHLLGDPAGEVIDDCDPVEPCLACLPCRWSRKESINHINKLDFLEAFPQARGSAFQAETI
jgi:hypothetical protein